jgi:putative oxidoreductase
MAGRWADLAFTLLRVVSGLMFACHGGQKLFGWFGATPMTDKPLMLAAGIIELAGGLLIAFGLFTRVAAVISSGEMAVAYFMAHAPQSFWPIQNKGEGAVLNCLLFLYVAARGAGPRSLDAALGRRSSAG